MQTWRRSIWPNLPTTLSRRLPARHSSSACSMCWKESRLGAKVLTRTVLTGATERMRAATRYLRHGEGRRRLRPTFLERLESSLAVKRSPHAAIAGARAAFARFGASNTPCTEIDDVG